MRANSLSKDKMKNDENNEMFNDHHAKIDIDEMNEERKERDSRIIHLAIKFSLLSSLSILQEKKEEKTSFKVLITLSFLLFVGNAESLLKL